MDEVTHTILPNTAGGCWGGTALGAGFGGLIGSWLGNGGFGGFGGNRAGIGYDTGALNGIQGQLNNVSGQIANADRDLLMQTSNQNQFIGNLDSVTRRNESGNVPGFRRDQFVNRSRCWCA